MQFSRPVALRSTLLPLTLENAFLAESRVLLALFLIVGLTFKLHLEFGEDQTTQPYPTGLVHHYSRNMPDVLRSCVFLVL